MVAGLRIRVRWQEGARLGRMVRVRRGCAPIPLRPVVDNGYERQFVYVYGAVSPVEGSLDWMICREMNTDRMSEFLAHVSRAHADEFLLMVVDGASSHIAHALRVPENIRLYRLPGYAPELNPQEHVWDELREKEFPNRFFDSIEGVLAQLGTGLPKLAANPDALRQLPAWPWIISLTLNANQNNRSREPGWGDRLAAPRQASGIRVGRTGRPPHGRVRLPGPSPPACTPFCGPPPPPPRTRSLRSRGSIRRRSMSR